jgi:hypothetical protein
MSRTFTDKEKVAYYKKLALGAPAPARRAPVRRAPARSAPARKAPARKAPVYKKQAYIKGRGSYSTEKGEKGEKKGIGERIGSTLGAGIGKGVHMLVKHLTGFGDYNVEYNSLMEGGLSPPELVNSAREGGVIVRHREYLGDISATVNFNLTSYPLNPGMADTFPWLSGVATSFEQYKFRGVVFEFISLSSDAILSASTSSALGAVIMATEYNSLNDNFINKAQMENHEFGNSRKPSLNFMHPVECKKSLTSVDLLYVRGGAIPAGADIRLYDLGKTEIATVGMQAASGVAGELWVTYEVELYKPQLNDNVIPDSQLIKMDHFTLGTLANAGTSPLGTTVQSPAFTSNLGGVITTALVGGVYNGVYTFPASAVGETFYLCYTLSGSSVVISPSTIAAYGGTAQQMYKNNTATSFSTGPGTTSGTFVYMMTIRPTSSSCTFQMNGGGTLPTNALGDLYIISMPANAAEIEDVTDQDEEKDDDKSIEDEEEIPEAIKRYLKKKGISL